MLSIMCLLIKPYNMIYVNCEYTHTATVATSVCLIQSFISMREQMIKNFKSA